jgi:choline dehydrogenase-like flavoprotein
MKRKNLTVETRAFVTEIHYEGRRATGVTESPIPDNCSNCGVLNAPPDKMTSLASMVCSLPFFLYVTYLHPAMKRKNLTVETRAFVTEIHYEGRRATGVRRIECPTRQDDFISIDGM